MSYLVDELVPLLGSLEVNGCEGAQTAGILHEGRVGLLEFN